LLLLLKLSLLILIPINPLLNPYWHLISKSLLVIKWI
jgi:hypothetical protein